MRVITPVDSESIRGSGGGGSMGFGSANMGFNTTVAGAAYKSCTDQMAAANPETNSADASLMGDAICFGIAAYAGFSGGDSPVGMSSSDRAALHSEAGYGSISSNQGNDSNGSTVGGNGGNSGGNFGGGFGAGAGGGSAAGSAARGGMGFGGTGSGVGGDGGGHGGE